MKALAEPNRREILRLVRTDPKSVNEITEHFAITQQAVSLHLRVLKDAGLVAMHKDGNRHLYGVNPDGFDTLESLFAELWPARLEALKQSVEDDYADR